MHEATQNASFDVKLVFCWGGMWMNGWSSGLNIILEIKGRDIYSIEADTLQCPP